MSFSITVSRTYFYSGTTQIFLTINVKTCLQSRELSTPLPLGAIFNSYVLTRASYECQQGHKLLVDQCLNSDTIHTATVLLYYQRQYHWVWSRKLSMSQLRHDSQPLYQNRERSTILLSRGILYGVSILTSFISSC